MADRRSDLNLQIDLLAEYEMKRVIALVDAIARKLEVTECDNKELAGREEDTIPNDLLKGLDRRAKKLEEPK